MNMDNSWFIIDGTLESLDYEGPTFFRLPIALAERVIADHSAPGDWVLDPFCGFGTVLVAAQRLGRCAVGIEKDPGRSQFAASRTKPPSRVIAGDVREVATHELPLFSLLFTSPPYTTFRNWDEQGFVAYFDDLRVIFEALTTVMKPGARVIVEISNVRTEQGVRTVAWDAAKVLTDIFRFEGEIVRCNTGPEPAGPGYKHSYILIFTTAIAGQVLRFL
jgi:SAM-dependent methyltransferase